MSTSGGPAVKLGDEVVGSAFAVLDGGIYYLDAPSGDSRLRFFDFATARSTTLAAGLGDVRPMLTSSGDGRTVFFTRMDSSGDDLMLVESFR